jgi:cobalt-zinc-cadmium efflux system outer membrane protein
MHFRRLAPCLFAIAAAARGEAPMTIGQAVAEAVEKNVGLLAERANIAIAEARVITARMRPNPSLSLSANHLDALGSGFDSDNAGGPSEFTAHTDFTVERGGKRALRTEAAQAARTVAELQFQNAVRTLKLDVQSAFVDVLLAKETLELARKNLASLNQIVEINAARLEAGDLAEVEVIRSRLAALQQENAARQAQARLRNALLQLQMAMGRPLPSPAFDVTGELAHDASVPDLEELRRAAAELRPDLLAMHRDAERAAAEWRSQMAQAKVDYVVGTEYTRQFLNARSNSLGFTFNVNLPFFNRNQGEIERAAQERSQAQLRAQATRNKVAGEVALAFEQYTTARDLLRGIEQHMLKQARDVREITEFAYKRGDASLLELLDAQRAFNETMQAYGEARAEYTRSLYVLESISGKAITK